jgi:UDP-N-acetylmuramate--alanine ligase
MGDWTGRRLHVIGIAGAGMSAYAIVCRALGATVTGSDRAESPYLARVREAGVEVALGHAAGNVPPGDDVEVVVSTAIPSGNPERVAARERGLRELSRADLLAELTALRRTIAVAGAHGKTTTTSMLAHGLLACGLDPGYLIGGTLSTTGTNAAWGTGEWLVVEADESDRSFLRLDVDIAVVTNVELDHHTEWGSRSELDAAFAQFMAGARDAVVIPGDDAGVHAIVERLAAHEHGSAAEGAVLEAHEQGSATDGSERTAVGAHALGGGAGDAAIVPFAPWSGPPLAVPGEHNRRNAAAALAAGALAGAEPHELREALATFRGAGRRFEPLGVTASGARVVDDYAHHPTEVAATIAAARETEPAPRRVVALFQPHLFSRTQHLAREFGAALAAADVVALVDVYPARERAEDFPGVSGLTVAEHAADAAAGKPVLWLPDRDRAAHVLAPLLREGDLCLVMGAGDVDTVGRALVAGGRASS